jgi:hypothetical protein
MARKTKRSKKKSLRKVYSIIVDGKCEQWYFQLMRKHENLSNIKIVPELPTKKKLKNLFNIVQEKIMEGYDKIIWLIDFDTLIKEERETPRGEKGKIQELKEYLSKLKQFKNIYVLVNSPCLEIWYLLHFEKSSKIYINCGSVITKLKRIEDLKDYKKSEDYYKKENSDIYKKLKPYLNNAIENAKFLGNFDFKNVYAAKAEMYKIFELLKIS